MSIAQWFFVVIKETHTRTMKLHFWGGKLVYLRAHLLKSFIKEDEETKKNICELIFR